MASSWKPGLSSTLEHFWSLSRNVKKSRNSRQNGILDRIIEKWINLPNHFSEATRQKSRLLALILALMTQIFLEIVWYELFLLLSGFSRFNRCYRKFQVFRLFTSKFEIRTCVLGQPIKLLLIPLLAIHWLRPLFVVFDMEKRARKSPRGLAIGAQL